MKRRFALIHIIKKIVERSPQQFGELDYTSIELYLDITNKGEAAEIIDIISSEMHYNRFRLIIWHMLKGLHNDTVYRKEGDNVGAMKFNRKGQPNLRIYCKEIPASEKEKRKIVMTVPFTKTSQENNNAIKQIIKSIQEYEYTYYLNKDEY